MGCKVLPGVVCFKIVRGLPAGDRVRQIIDYQLLIMVIGNPLVHDGKDFELVRPLRGRSVKILFFTIDI